MKRWTWNLFCLFSLLVFLLSVTIWVRSYARPVRCVWRPVDGVQFLITLEDSHLNVVSIVYNFARATNPSISGVDVPLGLFLIFAIPPILWWRKWRREGGRGGRGFPVSVAEASGPSRDREVREDAKTAAKG